MVTREISNQIPSGTRPWNPTLDKERQGWGTRQRSLHLTASAILMLDMIRPAVFAGTSIGPIT
jgi:hypothetical protein